MKSVKIYLSPHAYYVRLNMNDFEQEKGKGPLNKWIENRKGMLLYEYIKFVNLDLSTKSQYPKTITKIGLNAGRILCYHPFDIGGGSNNIFEPKIVVSNSEHEIKMVFDNNESNKLSTSNKYYTKKGEPYVIEVSFYVDKSTCNLSEKVSYSDGDYVLNYYHLIAPKHDLQSPEYYALFNFA